MARKMLRNVVKRGVHSARNGPSPPPCVAQAEIRTADRLRSREGSSRAPAGEGRELLRPSGDERVRSLSDRGAVSFKANFAACQPQAQRTPGALDHAQTHLIPNAAMSEASSNRWNLSVISDFSFSA